MESCRGLFKTRMNDRPSPIVGITCTEIQADRSESPPRQGQSQSYLRAISRAGAAPLLIPFLDTRSLLRSLYERVDGLLLSGGGDIDPVHYGETRHERCGRVIPERDETELLLVRWAMDDGKPLLAICRGIQVLNVALGGSLYQDIEAQVPGAGRHDWYPGYPRDYRPHTVTLVPHSRLAGILKATFLPVNSFHHQAVRDPAAGLSVVAHAPDGIIEAVEAEGHPFAIGVQWHPEEMAADDEQAQRLFDAFVGQLRAVARQAQ